MAQVKDSEIIHNSFHVLGTSHKRAPVEVRERLAVPPSELGLRARQLREETAIQGAVILSNCLRSEFYVCGAASEIQSAMDAFWSRVFEVEPARVRQFLYLKSGAEAVSHLFRVVAGLGSIVVGENQACEQVAEALAVSLQAGAAGATLEKIFAAALQCGEQVQAKTRIGRRNLSLGQAVVELVEKIFGSLDSSTILLIGGGPTCELAARELSRGSADRIWVASPDARDTEGLAQRLGERGTVLAWEDLREGMSQADVVINASLSERRALKRSDYERIRSLRQRRPLFLLDLTVPRGIDPALGCCQEIFLYNIDDIAPVAAAFSRRYSAAIQEVESLVRQQAEQFLRHLDNDPLSTTLLALERQLERIRQEQLTKNRSKLRGLTGQQQRNVERLTSAITRKIFREVENELKLSAAEGDGRKISESLSLMLGLVWTAAASLR